MQSTPIPVNIVSLVELNPLELTNTYQVKLLEKIKTSFTSFEQHSFLASFYCYLNYDEMNDFVIDLDNIWTWIGFSTKQKALFLLENKFVIDKDYKLLTIDQVKQKPDNIEEEIIEENEENKNETSPKKQIKKSRGGGLNKKIYMMTIHTFKLYCLQAGTKKASEIHSYYVKLERILQEVIKDESKELKQKLQIKDEELQLKNNEIEQITIQTSMDLKVLKEKTMIDSYDRKQVVYIGKFEDKLKFGFSDNIKRRVNEHKHDFGPEFILLYVVESSSNVRIEKEIKKILKSRIVSKVINEKNQTELIQISDEYTAEMFYQQIQDIKDNFLKTLTIELLEKEINEHIFRITELENIEIQLNTKIKAMEKTLAVKDKEFQEINKRATGSNSWAIELTKDNSMCRKRINELEMRLQTEEDIVEEKIANDCYPVIRPRHEIIQSLKENKQIPQNYVDPKSIVKTQISEPPSTQEPENPIILQSQIQREQTKPIIETPTIEHSKIVQANKKAVKVKKNDKHIIARNIETGEERTYKTYNDVHLDPDIQIGVHSLPDNYLNKPLQYKGFVFYEFGKPYWEPPENFIFYNIKKPSTHMQMCKSIEISSGKITFFNSMTEASWYLSLQYPGFEYGETNRRTLRHACTNATKSIVYPISLYEWSKCDELIGSWKNK